jgi:hypothetical protein
MRLISEKPAAEAIFAYLIQLCSLREVQTFWNLLFMVLSFLFSPLDEKLRGREKDLVSLVCMRNYNLNNEVGGELFIVICHYIYMPK